MRQIAGFDESFDWVVIGSGGGSMCSALVMRDAGRTVVILEKMPLVGGSTSKSGGVMWIPDNLFMRRDGIADSPEQAETYLQNLVAEVGASPGSTPERRMAYFHQAPRMLEYLLDKGITLDRARFWPDYYDERPGGIASSRSVVPQLFDLNQLGAWKDRLQPGFMGKLQVKLEEATQLPFYRRSWKIRLIMLRVAWRTVLAKLTGREYASAGAALQGFMLKTALAAGVDIRPETPVSELVEQTGAIVGVVTEKNGKPWRIGARLGVLVNAGGFSRNQPMRDVYQPGTRADWTQTSLGDTGEMIAEMQRHGAAVAQMDTMVGTPITLPPGFIPGSGMAPGVQSLTGKPHAILVDQSGARFMNEGGSYELYCRNLLKRNLTVPAIPSWAIFDSYYIDNYMLAGTMPGRANKPRHWTAEGFLRKADTVEELAGLIAIDPAALRATIERWNGFVDNGRDEDFHRGERAYDKWLGDPFHRPSPSRGRVDEPPFYAVPVYPGDVGTYGGVMTDAQARVLRADGSIIPGLYATGVATASVMGRCYPGAGASVGPAFTFGYIAAKSALAQAGSLPDAARQAE